MQHCNIICSIIKHAVTGNVSGVRDYAWLLAQKLRSEGDEGQVRMVERAASGIPPSLEQSIDVGQMAIVPEHMRGTLPEKPEYEGRWWPIYWTPIVGSGERITAFVVAVGNDGQWCCRPTITAEVLHRIVGTQASVIFRVFQITQSSIEATLDAKGDFAQWSAPTAGFVPGPCRHTFANNVRQIAAQGICLEAFMADSSFSDLNQA